MLMLCQAGTLLGILQILFLNFSTTRKAKGKLSLRETEIYDLNDYIHENIKQEMSLHLPLVDRRK